MSSSPLPKSWPSFNAANFSKFHSDATDKRMTKKLSLYISTEDNTPQQVIKKDRSNILIRYLYQQLDKKNMKRRVGDENPSDFPSTSTEEPRSKLPRNTPFHSGAANSSSIEEAIDNAANNNN